MMGTFAHLHSGSTTQDGILHADPSRYVMSSDPADQQQQQQQLLLHHQQHTSFTTHPLFGQSKLTDDVADIDNFWATHQFSRPSVSPLNSAHEATTATAPSSENNYSTNPNASGHKKTQYHKTKLCPWHREGKCFMGDACNYAHARDELRPKPDLSRTKLCPEVVKGRRCDRPGCRFAHDFVELRATSTFFKTRICKFWQRGYCPAGEECRHAHGKEDLRAYPSNSSPSEDDSCSVEGLPCDPQFAAWRKRNSIPGPGTGPPLSSLPSPSFMSTMATTPMATQKDVGAGDQNALLGPILQQCAELLGMSLPMSVDEASSATELLRSWISDEVDRQWQARILAASPGISCSNKSEDDECASPRGETSLLPQSLLQGLQTTTSPLHNSKWQQSGECDNSPSPSFAGAVQALLAAAASAGEHQDPEWDNSPAHMFLKTLGEHPTPSPVQNKTETTS